MYPSRQEYQVAVLAAGKVLKVPRLRNAQFEHDRWGLPKIWSGSYAAVFKCRDHNGQEWALRCPTKNFLGVDFQYEAMNDYLRCNHLDYMVEFEYVKRGFFVANRDCPVSISRWIKGLSIKSFIEQNRGPALAGLRTEWERTVRDMAARGIAHGDLQHENILIEGNANNPRIRLLDYDSFVCPANLGRPESIAGVPHYQHPRRAALIDRKDPRVDRFSVLVITLSIAALESYPGLWDKLDLSKHDGLLVDKSDFDDPNSSSTLAILDACGGYVARLTRALRHALHSPDPLDCPYPWDLPAGSGLVRGRAAAKPAWMQQQHVAMGGSAVSPPSSPSSCQTPYWVLQSARPVPPAPMLGVSTSAPVTVTSGASTPAPVTVTPLPAAVVTTPTTAIQTPSPSAAGRSVVVLGVVAGFIILAWILYVSVFL